MKNLVLIFVLLLAYSCFNKIPPTPSTPSTPPITPKPTTPVVLNDTTTKLVKGWYKEYNEYLEKIIPEHGKNLLLYKNDLKYWKKFFCALSGAESNFKPWDTYWENSLGVSCLSVWTEAKCDIFIKDWNSKSTRKASKNKKGWDKATETFYLSEGLLQLSYSDKNYYGCEFDWEADQNKLASDHSKSIFDPKKNIKCGVVILDRLIKKKKTPFFNSGHYWAVLKPKNKRHKDFKWYFNKSEVCKE